MAKKVTAIVKLQCPAGAANPAPPVGTALGPHGVNIMEFCKQFNARTQSQAGMVIPVVVTIYGDRTFTFITKTPPAAEPPAQGGRDREGQRHAEPDQGRQGHHGRSSRRSPRSRWPTSTRPTSSRRHAHDRRARPARWAWRSPTDASPRKEVPRRRRQGGPHAELRDSARPSSWSRQPPSPSSTRRWTSPSGSGVDPRHADQVVRGTVVLPHGTGKTVRVLVIAQGDRAKEAEAAGADFVGVEYIAEAQGRLARLRRHRRHARRHGPAGPAGPDSRSPRPDAEPEGRAPSRWT